MLVARSACVRATRARLPALRCLALTAESAAPAAPDCEKERRLAANQLRQAAELLSVLAPLVRTDVNLGSRVKELCGARGFNSSSRRLYAELCWTAVRHWGWLEQLPSPTTVHCAAWLAQETVEVQRLRAAGALHPLPLPPPHAARDLGACRDALAAFTGAPLCSPEQLAAPDWLPLASPPALLLSRSPLYLRLQRPGALEALRAEHPGLLFQPTALDGCVRCSGGGGAPELSRGPAHAAGAFEVQDMGSQLLLAAAGVAPGGAWLDACAGAGGKALQLAALLGERGRVAAEDVRPAALSQLRLRAARAGLSARVRAAPPLASAPPPGGFDGALVDAPCSGSGTWRRAPQLRWQAAEARLAAMAAQQLAILRAAAARVRPGGALLYATCSLARQENEEVVDAFLASAEGREFEPGVLPRARELGLGAAEGGRLALQHHVHDTDGFFLAAMRRRG